MSMITFKCSYTEDKIVKTYISCQSFHSAKQDQTQLEPNCDIFLYSVHNYLQFLYLVVSFLIWVRLLRRRETQRGTVGVSVLKQIKSSIQRLRLTFEYAGKVMLRLQIALWLRLRYVRGSLVKDKRPHGSCAVSLICSSI